MADDHSIAKERYEEAAEYWRRNYDRMLEDQRFSDPSDPQQWSSDAQQKRKGRVMLTLDQSNQFIVQVVNDARKNRPGINCRPADSVADPAVAQRLGGIIRHIEYQSRAHIAYDTAIENQARCGLGWLLVYPKIYNHETNEQDICIKSVHDPRCAMIDPNSMELDGQDAMFGFVETAIHKTAFKRKWPKADATSWIGDATGRWVRAGEHIVVADYFSVIETKRKYLRAKTQDGERVSVPEDQYEQLSADIGMRPEVVGDPYEGTTRKVKWCKLTGNEILEESEILCQFSPLIPVYGFVTWVDGERNVCGLTRRLMDSQRQYNYEESARTEYIALQPKAPIMTPLRAIDGHEKHWERLNEGSPAYLPYNDLDPDSPTVPISQPTRLAPPQFPVAFAQGSQIAFRNMQAAVGMYKSALGLESNSVSGRAKLADKEEGDTATFHFPDNLHSSIEQLGRVIVDMIPKYYDTRRTALILGDDGKESQVMIDPDMPQAVKRQGKKVVAINPGVGRYDVYVKAGPSYTTQRMETSQNLKDMIQAVPALAPALVPVFAKLQDFPDAEKVAKIVASMSPPEVQKILSETDEGGPDIPPAVQAQMQQMSQMLDAAEQRISELEAEKQKHDAEIASANANAELAATKADTERLRAETEHIRAVKEMQELNAPRVSDKDEIVDVTPQPIPAQQSATAPSVQVVLPESFREPFESSVAPALEAMAQSAVMTQQAIASIAAAQQEVAQRTEQVLAEVSRPRKSLITVTKDSCGNFVGEKTEV